MAENSGWALNSNDWHPHVPWSMIEFCQSIEDASNYGLEDEFIKIISDLLDQSSCDEAGEQDTFFNEGAVFNGDRVNFSATYYLQRIAKYSSAGPSCFISALLYLERLKSKSHPIILTTRNMQRLLLVAVMTASKFLEDFCSPIACWAEIGAISVAELKALELSFLFELDFQLLISPEDHARVADDLLLYAALREASRRPWCLPPLSEPPSTPAGALLSPDDSAAALREVDEDEDDGGAARTCGGSRRAEDEAGEERRPAVRCRYGAADGVEGGGGDSEPRGGGGGGAWALHAAAPCQAPAAGGAAAVATMEATRADAAEPPDIASAESAAAAAAAAAGETPAAYADATGSSVAGRPAAAAAAGVRLQCALAAGPPAPPAAHGLARLPPPPHGPTSPCATSTVASESADGATAAAAAAAAADPGPVTAGASSVSAGRDSEGPEDPSPSREGHVHGDGHSRRSGARSVGLFLF